MNITEEGTKERVGYSLDLSDLQHNGPYISLRTDEQYCPEVVDMFAHALLAVGFHPDAIRASFREWLAEYEFNHEGG